MRQCAFAHNGRRVALAVCCCDGFMERARGRIGAGLALQSQAWRLHPCRAVHTFFLTNAIDVVFCDARHRVLRLVTGLAPYRWAREPRARSVWEFPAGSVARLALRHGDLLMLCE